MSERTSSNAAVRNALDLPSEIDARADFSSRGDQHRMLRETLAPPSEVDARAEFLGAVG
jgi:hypothetical protein